MAKTSLSPDSNLPFLEIPGFAAPGVAHGFFGRRGGVSDGIFAGLNCGPGSADDPADVKENRSLVASALGVDVSKVLSLHQIHSATCLKVMEKRDDRPQADAQVTDVPGLALGVLTADCAPVLFHGMANGRPVVGAAHAGWKGAVGGVLDETVVRMQDYGVKVEDIKAAVGPCINKKSYEVGPEFLEQLLKDDDENERFFMSASKPDHYMFDLAGFCAFRLYKIGLTKIFISGVDTYSNENDYFSFRRATHRKEPDYGRQISVIMIR